LSFGSVQSKNTLSAIIDDDGCKGYSGLKPIVSVIGKE